MKIDKKYLYLIAALFAVGFSIYYFNLHNELFWDDEDWILNNATVHTLSWTNIKFWFTHNTLAGIGLKSNYYRPFLFFTFALNYMISGVKPLAYHLTSNFIHIFNGILIFWLIRDVFKRNLFAFLVSIFFLIHPLQTEAITYISGRGDALVAMFMLLSLLLFYKAESQVTTSQVTTSDSTSQVRIFGLAMSVFLALGLLSRETGIIFPILALVFYVSFLSKDRFLTSVKRGLEKTWPYFGVVIVYGILRLTALNFLDTLNFYIQPNPYSEHLYIRFFTFLSTLLTYFKLLIIPTGLHMERGTDVFDSLFSWPVWLGFASVIFIIWWLYYLYKNYQISDNLQPTTYKPFRIWFFGVGWFVVTIAPVSGITPINALIYEHWLYLPMVGFWFIVSFYIVKIFDYLKLKGFVVGRWSLVVGLVIYFSFFGYQSVKRNILWGNPEAFYQDILKYEPDSARVNNNLGNFYFNRGDKDKAEIYYKKAVEINDIFPQSHYNYGSILESKEDYFGAAQEYKKAIEIDPNFYYAYQGLVILYAKTGNISEAVLNIEQLKKLIPENPRVYYNAALLYIAQNNKEEALRNANEGLKYVQFDLESGPLLEDLIKTIKNPPKKK